MTGQIGRGKLAIWQIFFILFSTSWLLAPVLNHTLSYKSSLISHYEAGGQPYAWLFRLCDIIGALLLAGFAAGRWRQGKKSIAITLLSVVAAGMLLDAVFTSNCHMTGNVCYENYLLQISLHAVESIVSFMALLWLSVHDARTRHKLVSVAFAIFQSIFGVLFVGQYFSHASFSTAFQMVYQTAVVVWIAWFCRDYFTHARYEGRGRLTQYIRYAAAVWTLLNGLLAILISLSHLDLFGKIKGLYFAGNTALLAQHSTIIGIIMLYLSRHLMRGERRARQILLAILAVETLKYSAVTPNGPLLALYGVTFCLLFISIDDFQRGVIPMTWRVRLKDLTYLLVALVIAAALAFLALDRDNQISRITANSLDNFSDYALHSNRIHVSHRESILLTHTITTFAAASLITIFWVLFRPYKHSDYPADSVTARRLLEKHSQSSEDYFKIWPPDKQYFYGHEGFIAYKVTGSITFALADPVISEHQKGRLLEDFLGWARSRRLTACFLPVPASSLPLYKDLESLQIGATAIIDTSKFIGETSKDKWWRWKTNRAIKEGYTFETGLPPHSRGFLDELDRLSSAWLGEDHQERGFALGYFDRAYLQECIIYCLRDSSGRLAAFANRLPSFNAQKTVTVDLMRYSPEARDPMPYLLSQIIQSVHSEGCERFDLGYVPFAGSKGPIQLIAKTVSAGRFSAKGLEQFKNKFDPEWHDYYLVYDGDLGDLAAIALNIEKAMSAT